VSALERTGYLQTSVERWPYLLRFAELLDDLGGHLEVLQQMIRDGVSDPRRPLCWAELQQLVPGLLAEHSKRKARKCPC